MQGEGGEREGKGEEGRGEIGEIGGGGGEREGEVKKRRRWSNMAFLLSCIS